MDCAFYHGKTKWEYSQMETRLSKHNTAYLKVYNQEAREKIEWSAMKRKTDLIEQRKHEIAMKKQIADVKG